MQLPQRPPRTHGPSPALEEGPWVRTIGAARQVSGMQLGVNERLVQRVVRAGAPGARRGV